MKKYILGISIIVVVFLSITYFYHEKKELAQYFEHEKKSALYEQVSKQKAINAKLAKIAKEKKYTFSNPYIILNPYEISPLSALIIFNTEKLEKVEVYINDEFVTTMMEAQEHRIPIYGLKEDTANLVKLVIKDTEKTFTIKTEKSNIAYPLVVEKRSETLNNSDIYFMVASYETYLTGWDNAGNLRFYLTVDNRMDVEWLPNGHFLIGTAQGQFAENFVAFVEMDYLGKIYNYYIPSNGYSFEFQVLTDGSYMLAGGDKPVYINEQVIYTLDATTGATLDLINLAAIIKEIDSDFDATYLGQKAIRNAFYYDELTDNLVVSFRGFDAIFSFSFKEKKLNWVFTNPQNELFSSSVWKDYLIESTNGIYPEGEHSVIITRDGNLAFFNNGYNRLHGFENGGNDLVSYYRKNYSSVDIFKITNKKAKLVWRYDASKKLFSHQYGSVQELSNGYLLNFGYNLKEQYRLSKKGSLSLAEADVANIYASIIEVDENAHILFKATCEEGKYRAFKEQFYAESTTDTDIKTLKILNNLEKEYPKKVTLAKDIFESSEDWLYESDFTQNTFTTNYPIQSSDTLTFYFLDKRGKVYSYQYKEETSKNLNKIFNLILPQGDYVLYLKLNDIIYNTNTVYTF